jgi:hypothetical protein
MRRIPLAATLILIAAIPLLASAQEGPAPAPDERKLPGCALRYEYLRRESAAERENYHRLSFGVKTTNLWLNPSAGVELRMDDSQLRTYFVGDDIRLDKRSAIHLRLNHVEYGDWETSINFFNAYLSYQIWWFRFAVGVGYAAINFEPKHYQDPLYFNAQMPETRFIYDLSLHPVLWDHRLEFEAGLRNYNDFEYNGFDDTGYHLLAQVNVAPKSSLSFYYERRYAAVFIALPTLTRVTWIVAYEQRF